MTKFEELCQKYIDSRNEYFSDENRCMALVVELVDKFADYLECPRNQIEYYPPKDIKEKYESDKKHNIHGSTRFNEDDAFWHVGIVITLYEAPNIHPHMSIRSELLIKVLDDTFLLKFGTLSEEKFKIHEGNKKEYNTFFEHMFQAFKSCFEYDSEFDFKDDNIRYIQ